MRRRHKYHKKNHFITDFNYQQWKEKNDIQPGLSTDQSKAKVKSHKNKNAKKPQK